MEKLISDSDFLLAIDNKKTELDGLHPTIREIMGATPYNSTSAVRHRLNSLQAKGLLSRLPKISRSIRLTEAGLRIIKENYSIAFSRAKPVVDIAVAL